MWLEVLQLWNDMMKAGFGLRLIKTLQLELAERNVTFLFQYYSFFGGGRSLYSGNNIQVQEVIMEGSGELGDEWEGSKGQESFKTEDLL